MREWEIAVKRLLPLLGYKQEMKDAQLKLLGSPNDFSVRSLWYHVYNGSVYHKVFSPIEELDQNIKLELWEMTLKIAPQLNKENKIKVSKCLYTIEYYLNNPL